MVIPVGREVRQRRLYGNLTLYKKVETARDDYMQTRLNDLYVKTGDFHAQGAVKQVSAGVATV